MKYLAITLFFLGPWRLTAADISAYRSLMESDEADKLSQITQTYRDEPENPVPKLLLGVKYLDINPKLSLQYLYEDASDTGAEIQTLKNLYRALAYTRLGNYETSQNILERDLKWEELEGINEKQAYEASLQNLFEMGSYRRFQAKFHHFWKKFGSPSQDPDTISRALKVFEALGSTARRDKLLLHLMTLFPLTEASRLAFQTVETLRCDQKIKFFFDEATLKAMAMLSDLDPGIKAYVLGLLDGPVEFQGKKYLRLEEGTRFELLVSIRFYDEALALKDQVLRTSTDLADSYMEIGRIYSILDRNEAAIEAYTRAMQHSSERYQKWRLLRRMGNVMLEIGAYKSAIGVYRSALKLVPNRRLKWQLAWTHYIAGHYGKAAELLTEQGVGPGEGGAYFSRQYWQMKASEKLGFQDDAAIDLDPGSIYAQLRDRSRPIKKSAATRYATLASAKDYPHWYYRKNSGLDYISDLNGLGMGAQARSELLRWKMKSQKKEGLLPLAMELNDHPFTRNQVFRSYLRDNEISFGDSSQTPYWARVKFPLAYFEQVKRAITFTGGDPFLVLSIMRAESFYKPLARSRVGARGLLQMMPYTAVRIARLLGDRAFDLSDLERPQINIFYGAHYLKYLEGLIGMRSLPLIAASYNAGPERALKWWSRCKGCDVDEFVESIPYRETRVYVKKVASYYAEYAHIYGTSTENLLVLPADDVVQVTDKTLF